MAASKKPFISGFLKSSPLRVSNVTLLPAAMALLTFSERASRKLRTSGLSYGEGSTEPEMTALLCSITLIVPPDQIGPGCGFDSKCELRPRHNHQVMLCRRD